MLLTTQWCHWAKLLLYALFLIEPLSLAPEARRYRVKTKNTSMETHLNQILYTYWNCYALFSICITYCTSHLHYCQSNELFSSGLERCGWPIKFWHFLSWYLNRILALTWPHVPTALLRKSLNYKPPQDPLRHK